MSQALPCFYPVNRARTRANPNIQAKIMQKGIIAIVIGCYAAFPHTAASASEPRVLDDFESLTGWTTASSPQARVELVQDTGRTGLGLRLNFDFSGNAGYVIVRKPFKLSLPENYAFTFQIRGEAPVSNIEFKVLDPSGKNVWWRRQHDLKFTRDWRQYSVKKRMLEFAFGPSGGAPLKQVGAVELAIHASGGGKGSLWLDDFRLEKRDPAAPYELQPEATASTSSDGHGPEAVLDENPGTHWRSRASTENQWLKLDFLKPREYGGLLIDWDEDDFATAYQVQVSQDGEQWQPAYTVTAGNGRRDYIYMPDAESRYLRLALQNSSRGRGYAIQRISVQPFEFSASANQFFQTIAREAPRGIYPRYFHGEQSYFTVVGGDGGESHEGLLNADGALEVDKGAFTIEPFLYAGGKLITWSDVAPTQELEAGFLPIPSVTWRHENLVLKITAFAHRETLFARYRVENHAADEAHGRLFLALRPFQVNPPWQSLNMVGGTAKIGAIRREGRVIEVDGERSVIPLVSPDHIGAAMFDQGPVTDWLRKGQVPADTAVVDPFWYASGALEYELELPAGASRELFLAIPFRDSERVLDTITALGTNASAFGPAQLRDALDAWSARLQGAEFDLPAAARKFTEVLKSNLAYIFIHRDGAAIQPGSRTYARSWIRDGAITASALLGMGYPEEVRQFIEWYAGFQFADGKIPCCVDRNGADGVPENDSHGQFIYAIAEYYRYTRDIGFVREMWPRIVNTMRYIESQRGLRMTQEYRKDGNKRIFYGLMPESISHEGYAARPVHAYWDDFWTLRGLKDAAWLAGLVPDESLAERYAKLRDDFAGDLYASIRAVMRKRKLAYIPASAELADFDSNAVAMFVTVAGELANLPQPALSKTFEDWWDFFQKRRDGKVEWDAYTPYEIRMVEALVHLGQRERALALLNYLLADQTPPAWNQWAEVVWHDRKAPKFIGDLPHTWIGAEYVRALRSLFAYERESDRALVLAAGLPREWLDGEAGVGVKRLPTWYGTLSYTLKRTAPREWRLKLDGDLNLPPGGIVIQPPLERPIVEVLVNGNPSSTFDASEVLVREFPSEIIVRQRP
jgi:hypothetical protein